MDKSNDQSGYEKLRIASAELLKIHGETALKAIADHSSALEKAVAVLLADRKNVNGDQLPLARAVLAHLPNYQAFFLRHKKLTLQMAQVRGQLNQEHLGELLGESAGTILFAAEGEVLVAIDDIRRKFKQGEGDNEYVI